MRLRLLRVVCGWSVADMAEVAGCSKSAMEKLLASGMLGMADPILNLARATGVKIEWLLFGGPQPAASDPDLARAARQLLPPAASQERVDG
jgi:transcriptional regulator with XRE-family HTH domain